LSGEIGSDDDDTTEELLLLLLLLLLLSLPLPMGVEAGDDCAMVWGVYEGGEAEGAYFI
jgi:hypothetical protein